MIPHWEERGTINIKHKHRVDAQYAVFNTMRGKTKEAKQGVGHLWRPLCIQHRPVGLSSVLSEAEIPICKGGLAS